MSAGGGDKKSSEVRSGFPKTENPIAEKINTTKELAKSVGIGHDTMNKVIQISEYAPTPVKEALDEKKISINQGYIITKELENMSLEDAEKEREAMLAVQRELERKSQERRNRCSEPARHRAAIRRGFRAPAWR